MSSKVLGAVVTLVALTAVYRIILGSRRRPAPFSRRRAGMRMQTPTGGNTAAVLAAVVIAQTGLDLARQPEVADAIVPAALVAVMIALVFAVAIDDRRGGLLLTTIGVSAALLGTTLDVGPIGAVLLLVVSLPMIWILGLIRGFSR